MQGIRLCSPQAKIPYHIEDMELNIYSVEELAYYLYHTVFFVDTGFFNERLTEYIRTGLELPGLAAKLKHSMELKNSFSDLVMLVVRESQYYEEDELKQLQKNLDIIRSKRLKERMKVRAELLYQGGKLAGANEIYNNILSEKGQPVLMTGNQEHDEFYGSIYLGLGKIKVRMFYFAEAAEDFKKAYILYPDRESGRALIHALLLGMDYQGETKEELLGKIAAELGTLTLEEEMITQCIDDLKESAIKCELTKEYEYLEKVITYDGCRNLDDFYEGIHQVVDEWKQEYRKLI